MQIATWNVNSLNVRLPQVLQWLESNPVDVLALQELKLDQDKFPISDIEAAGYQAAWFGQKTYNGVALLTRQPLTPENVLAGIPGYDDEQRRVIAATVDGVRIVCAYCVNGESIESPKFQYKLTWFEHLTRYIAESLQHYPQLVLLGDFNIAPADIDVYDPQAWAGKVLCSAQERTAFQTLQALGLHDSLRALQPEITTYSWWDYRMAMFRRNLGLRIDHILITDPLLKRAQACQVDTIPRGWERPSDHAPVVLTLQKL